VAKVELGCLVGGIAQKDEQQCMSQGIFSIVCQPCCTEYVVYTFAIDGLTLEIQSRSDGHKSSLLQRDESGRGDGKSGFPCGFA
jgi:hypothetical protein